MAGEMVTEKSNGLSRAQAVEACLALTMVGASARIEMRGKGEYIVQVVIDRVSTGRLDVLFDIASVTDFKIMQNTLGLVEEEE